MKDRIRPLLNPEGKPFRYTVSIMAGLLCFLGAHIPISFLESNTLVHLNWSMIFPLLIALLWGARWSLVSLFVGLGGLYPFSIWPHNLWVALFASFNIFLLVMGHGLGADQRRKGNRSVVFNLFFLQMVFSLIILFDMLVLTPWVLAQAEIPALGFRPASLTLYRLLSLQGRELVNMLVLVSLADVLTFVPPIRRLFGLPVSNAHRESARMAWEFILCGSLISMLASIALQVITESNNRLEVRFYPEVMSDVKILLGILMSSMGGSILASHSLRRHEAESQLRSTSDHLRAIIESTKYPVWLVDRDFHIVSYNEGFADYLREKLDIVLQKGERPEERLPANYIPVLHRFYAKAIVDGKYTIDVMDNRHQRYLELSFFPVDKNGEVTEISVFCRDITRRKQSEQELIQLNENLELRVQERTAELQTALQEMEDFTYTVSHDLKVPLKAIDSYHRILLEDYGATLDPGASDMVRRMGQICGNVYGLIDRLLEYSRTSRLDIHPEPLHLDALFKSVFDEMKPAQRVVELEFETGMPMVMADHVLMRQVVGNAVSNAIKFTRVRERASLVVGCRAGDNEYVFHLRDNGVGFDRQRVKQLFGIFRRLHTEKEYEGYGIGLSTIRTIIRKHGGNTWIEGEEDEGATLYFTLPVVREKETA